MHKAKHRPTTPTAGAPHTYPFLTRAGRRLRTRTSSVSCPVRRASSSVSCVCDGFLRCCSVLHCPQDRGVHNVHKAKHRPTPTAGAYHCYPFFARAARRFRTRTSSVSCPARRASFALSQDRGVHNAHRAKQRPTPVSPVAVLRFRQQVVVARAERASHAEDDGYHRRRRVGLQ